MFVLKCNVFLGFIILSHAFLKQNAACQGIQMWQQQVPIKRQYVMSRTSELESHQHIWRACLWTWRALLTATRDIIKTSSSACCLHRCRSVIPWLCQSFPRPYLPLLHSYSTNIQMWGFFSVFYDTFLNIWQLNMSKMYVKYWILTVTNEPALTKAVWKMGKSRVADSENLYKATRRHRGRQ